MPVSIRPPASAHLWVLNPQLPQQVVALCVQLTLTYRQQFGESLTRISPQGSIIIIDNNNNYNYYSIINHMIDSAIIMPQPLRAGT